MSLHQSRMTPTQAAAIARRQSFLAGLKLAIKPMPIPGTVVRLMADDPMAVFGPKVLARYGEIGPELIPAFGLTFEPSPDDVFGPRVCFRRWSKTIQRLLVNHIQSVVANTYKVTRTDLLSGRRAQEIIKPRHIAMYLTKRMTTLSLPAIGRQFAGRDHTTILSAIRKIERQRAEDTALNYEIAKIETLIGVNP